MMLEKRTLGQTDIKVTPVGLGVMQFSGGSGWFGSMFPVLPQEEKNAIIQAALDGGMNWFDTAELYGFGRSEQGLSAGLKAAGKQNDEVVVATKCFPFSEPPTVSPGPSKIAFGTWMDTALTRTWCTTPGAFHRSKPR